MKTKKTIKIIGILILIMVMIMLVIAGYFIFVDIESKVPEEVQESCHLEVKEYKNRKIFIITPKEETTNPLKILYFHGGSYVAEASKDHWNFIQKIVEITKATIIMPDYPLTPKHNYKDVFEMVEPLYQEIIQKIDTKNLILMGDSAGGGLTLALEEKIGEKNIPQPQKTILISPWLDVRLNNPKIDEVQKTDKELNKETLLLAGIAYAGEDGINSYLVNPIDGDLSKLQNIVIFTGTNDILNPDVSVLAEKAKQVGVNIQVKKYKDAPHIWFINQKGEKEVVEQGWKDLIEQLQVP